MRRTRFFILDRKRTPSLTLRDYSKVVAGYKLSFSKKNQFNKQFPRLSGGAMSPSRARWFRLYLSVFCFVVCLGGSLQVFAQGTGGRILGRIADPSGAVLSGAKVIATNDATGVTHDSQSNDTGDYVFPDLPVGTYSLTFDLTGFKKAIRHGIALDVNQVITLNMTMQLGAAQEVVDVTSEAPLVETSSTQLGAVV